ncbi:acyltransferase family protein [Angustibacter luteus]
MAFHAGVPFVSGGFVGVDVFFVLSGFLITGLLVDELQSTGRISLSGFYARRIRRLLPLSALVLVATTAAAFFLVPAVDRGAVGGDVSSAALGVANWHFAMESTQYMADTAKSPVLHYWSLAVEEQFYLVWPLLLICVAGAGGLAARRWVVARRRIVLALAVLGGGSLAVSWWVGGDGSFAYFGLHTRAWELAAGAGAALARPALPRLGRLPAVLAGYLGLALVVASAVVMDEQTPFPGTAALVPVVGTVLLVVSGARMYVAAVPRLLRIAPLRFVGRTSYAWYLWHWPCLVLVAARWGTVPAGSDDGAPRLTAPVTLLVVLVSLALAVVSHQLVEQPARALPWLRVSRLRTAAVGAGLVVGSLVAAASLTLPVAAQVEAIPTGYGLAVPAATPPAAAMAAASATAPTSAGRPTATAPSPMTVQEARADFPPNGNACYIGYPRDQVPPTTACRYGAPHGTRTIALIGDSHAAQWLPAFVQAAKDNGWTLYYFAKSACAPVDVPVWSPSLQAVYANCPTWRHTMLTRLAAIKGLDAVFVGRYMIYTRDARTASGARVPTGQLGARWQAGMARTVAALPDVPRVVVLQDTPRPGVDVPTCLSKHPANPAACAFARAGHTHLDAELLRAEVAASPRVSTLDLTDLVCPTASCPVVTQQGVVLYRDHHHLTASFSKSLAPAVGQRLAQALG